MSIQFDGVLVFKQSVARNVEDIAQMTENNSAAVQQVAHASTELLSMASSLEAMVRRFKLN